MIRIAICDDDKDLTRDIQMYLREKNAQLSDVNLQVSIYHSGESFLQDIGQGARFHIVFMDIQMDGINGVETGSALRNTPDGDEVTLIYMSTHQSYYKGITKVGVFRFMEKPFSFEELENVFERALKLIIKSANFQAARFHYKLNKDSFSVNINEIAYLKSKNRSIEIYKWSYSDKSFFLYKTFYSSIALALKQLPVDYFVQCERSHIVNLNFVKRISEGHLFLMDAAETKIPIGRAYKANARETYTKFTVSHYG